MAIGISTIGVGAQVKHKSNFVIYTVDMLDGDRAVIRDPRGYKNIVDVKDLSSLVRLGSDGWYTIANKPGFAYWIHWDNAAGGPVYLWGLRFPDGEPEPFPHPFGLNHKWDAFQMEDFKPIGLTTQRR